MNFTQSTLIIGLWNRRVITAGINFLLKHPSFPTYQSNVSNITINNQIHCSIKLQVTFKKKKKKKREEVQQADGAG